MMDPFVDMSAMSENELEKKIEDLTRKYFMTPNADLKFQIVRFLDVYKSELQTRRMKTYQEQFERQRDKGLDKLIKTN